MPNTIYLASDHAGFTLKEHLVAALTAASRDVVDMGVHSRDSCDYPDFAHAVCKKILAEGGLGILICGTGIGMSIAANRHAGIRAAVCTHEFHARTCREHNNANMLCLGGRITAPGLAEELVKIFLETPFAGGRHARRVDKVESE
jgi:ribose 5-phosphate isomerase B